MISPERLKRESPNFVSKWSISSDSLRMTDYSLIGMVMVT